MSQTVLFVGGPADGESRFVEDFRDIVYPVRIQSVTIGAIGPQVDYETVRYYPLQFGFKSGFIQVIYAPEGWTHEIVLARLMRNYHGGDGCDKT